ncbi:MULTISPECIES: Z-ring formation inhibitor MciZ [Bacillaceae]|nr:Z-ring formation inhibitor MciZ [Bacillus sp. S3]QCJ43352.1 Z-ring formation inhibitor MciZ [Bacillus sp. S3]
MKVVVHEKGIILVGKGWEILQKLKEYNKEYNSVTDWIQSITKK